MDTPRNLPVAHEPSGAALTVAEPNDLLRLALQNKVPVETIERLVALQERAEARFAAAEFNKALADFQAECPHIRRTSTAQVTTKSGSKYGYKYAELDEIGRVIREPLKKHGLSYSWDSDIRQDGKLVAICKLRHVAGHMETAQFVCPTGSDAGMSEQQKNASALTYAKRQSLVQVLGLTMTDHDNDGAAVNGHGDKITDKQALDIEDWVRETVSDLSKFLVHMGVERVADIRARDFQKAVAAFDAKRRSNAKKGGAP